MLQYSSTLHIITKGRHYKMTYY